MLFILSTLSPRHMGQYSFEPPILFAKVAPSWWPVNLELHTAEIWLPPPWVQQYLSVTLQGYFLLSGVFLVTRFPPPLLPRLLPPCGVSVWAGWCVDMESWICCNSFSISNCTGSDCTVFAWSWYRVWVNNVLSSESATDGAWVLFSTAARSMDMSSSSRRSISLRIVCARWLAWC